MPSARASPRFDARAAAAVVAVPALAGVALAGAGGPAWGAAVCGLAAAGLAGALLLRPRTDPAAAEAAERQRACSAQLRAEQAAAADLRAMLDAVREPLVASGPEGLVLAANPAADDLFGGPGRPLAGRPIDEVFTQAELLDVHASARRGVARRAEVRLPGREGPRVFEVAASPIALSPPPELPGGAATGVLVTLRDVTDLAQAVSVKSDFVANASHELRTPLAALRAAVETLQSDAAADPAMRARILEMVAGQLARLEEMVRDLLELSRLESPDLAVRPVPIRAGEIAERLSAMFEGVCRRRSLTLAVDLDPALDPLRIDRTLLFLILDNLVENAAKFAYEGTVIRVVGAPLPAPDDKAAAPRRWGVRFDVADKGVGIPLNQQGRVFERFYQVDEARTGSTERRGTGLGLAIVKHAVRALSGQVRVQSVWKVGTTMTVELPDCLDGEVRAFPQGETPRLAAGA